MREGWKCPNCGTVISPDVTEHRCQLTSNPIKPWMLPYNPTDATRSDIPYQCRACQLGAACNCVLGGWHITCGTMKRLGPEFEAAIFDNIEALYEN